MNVQTEQELISLCLALIDGHHGLSSSERKLVKAAPVSTFAPREIGAIRNAISQGADPLGEAFSTLRPADKRRGAGAVYTPLTVTRAMMNWLAAQGTPTRIVDPGAGSGRFIMTAGDVFPDSHLVGIEVDPLAALMLRANLSARGWTDRATVLVEDYREVKLPRCAGMTAFIGNPPYVRHHNIAEDWKNWYATTFAKLGIKASALAGLHLHFFLQTRLLAKNGRRRGIHYLRRMDGCKITVRRCAGCCSTNWAGSPCMCSSPKSKLSPARRRRPRSRASASARKPSRCVYAPSAN